MNDDASSMFDHEGLAHAQLSRSRTELAGLIARAVPEDGVVEVMDGLRLRRASAPTAIGHGVTMLAFCVIAQGNKEIWLGERCFRYDPAHYLIATANLPMASRITGASSEQPFLNVVLHLDPAVVGSVMVEAGRPMGPGRATATAIDVSPVDAGLLDAVVRLTRLITTPDHTRVLAPLITREIIYRLLVGEQGERLRHIVAIGAPAQPISRAIARLRRDFDRPLRMEQVAREIGMSTSAFHQHFKEVTAMSPLQFQKQLRLQEARRLMLGEQLDASSAGFRVGYDDPSYFSRDYKRLFGVPPARDAQRLRGTATESTGV